MKQPPHSVSPELLTKADSSFNGLCRLMSSLTCAKQHGQPFTLYYLRVSAVCESQRTLLRGRYDDLIANFIASFMKQCASCQCFQVTNSDLAIVVSNEELRCDTPVNKILTDLTRELEEQRGFQVNIGIADYPEDSSYLPDLLEFSVRAAFFGQTEDSQFVRYRTDIALKQAKVRQTADELLSAISNHELSLEFQPQYTIDGSEMVALEALLRWANYPPNEFLSLVEELPVIEDIAIWCMVQVIARTRELSNQMPEVGIAVNFSANQLCSERVFEVISKMVEDDPCVQKITIEITETAVINNYQVAIANLHRYKALGFRISLDDFGTGYSSLLHIKNIPADELKIDRVFVSSIETCPRTLNIIGALVTLCENMNMRLVAEGIESVSQRNILRSVGCQYVQGFLYSAPKPFEQIIKHVAKTEVA